MSQNPGCRKRFFSWVVAYVPAVGSAEGVLVEPGGARQRSIPIGPHGRRIARPDRRTGCRCPDRRRRCRLAVRTSNGAPDCAWKMPDDIPVAEHPAQRRRRRLERREAIADLRHQHVRAIEIRDAVVAAVVVGVRQQVAAAAAVVRRPRERVGDAEADAARAERRSTCVCRLL